MVTNRGRVRIFGLTAGIVLAVFAAVLLLRDDSHGWAVPGLRRLVRSSWPTRTIRQLPRS